MLKKILVSSILSCIFIMPASAKNYYMKFNDKDSKIAFFVSTTLHDFHGEAQKFKGSINITADDDTNQVKKAEGSLEITSDSLFSKDKKRDDRLKNEVLSVKKYPLIKLKVNSVKVTSDKIKEDSTMGMNLIGTLTIFNTTKNVSIPLKVKLDKNKTSAKVDGTYTLNFKEYNIPDPSIPFLSKVNENVKITFDLKAN